MLRIGVWIGREIIVLALLLGAAPAWAQTLLPFIPETALVGPRTNAYIDPEFLPGGNAIVYQDELGQGWMGLLDPTTGLFKELAGRDLKFDRGLVVRPSAGAGTFIYNGPEWGVDRFGESIFYTKADQADVLQIWRAQIQGGTATKSMLTSIAQSAWGAFASQDPTADSVTLHLGIGTLPLALGVWLDEHAPTQVNIVPRYYLASGGGRFASGSSTLLAYSMAVERGSTLETQAALLDLQTGAVQVVTDDEGKKTDVWAIQAPEYDGELLIAAVVDRAVIAIYRDLGDPSGYWTRIAEFAPPGDQPHRYLYSMEPIEGGNGLNGTSYFAVAACLNGDVNNPGDVAIWILGLGQNANNRFRRRVDDGALTGEKRNRFEPETHFGTSELFLYYSMAVGTATEFRQARTGLFVTP